MSEKQIKREFRLFTIAEYEKEEAYLARRHREGWKLVTAAMPGFYTFEECEPEEVIYQLDYNSTQGMEKEQYLQMFADCGWEYVNEMNGWRYFRKPQAQADGDEAIFSSDASRLELLGRVFRTRMLPILLLFFCADVPMVARALAEGLPAQPVERGILLGTLILFFFVLWIVLRCGAGLWQLRQRCRRDEETLR